MLDLAGPYLIRRIQDFLKNESKPEGGSRICLEEGLTPSIVGVNSNGVNMK